MIEKILKAKHWQIFTLMVGLPVLIGISTLVIIGMNLNFESVNPDLKNMLSVFAVFPIIMILYTSIFFVWLWSIAMGLQKKMPENVKMKTRTFKVLFFIPFTYIILISIFMGGEVYGFLNIENIIEPSEKLITLFIGLMLVIHLFSMFCIFYLLYFTSKTIKTVELQREAELGDYILEFILLWFYIIGIWIIQPKINKLFEQSNSANSLLKEKR